MNKRDIKAILSKKIDQAFIIEVILGVLMIIVPLIWMLNYGQDPTLVSIIVAGIFIVFFALYYYRSRSNLKAQATADDNFYNELNTRMNETFVMQLIFGVAMVVAALVSIIIYGFNLSIITTLISGALLIVYSIYYYKIRINLKELGKKGDKSFEKKASSKLNETFTIQIIFGVAMIIAALVSITTYGFDVNIIMTLISGGFLVVYSIYYYRVRISLVDLIKRTE